MLLLASAFFVSGPISVLPSTPPCPILSSPTPLNPALTCSSTLTAIAHNAHNAHTAFDTMYTHTLPRADPL